MKVYLAGAFSRQKELQKVAFKLSNLGVHVTSRWLYEIGPNDPNNPASVRLYRRETAFMDIQDVRESDMLVRFTDKTDGLLVPARLISGARMFEFGMAWERGIPIVVVGGSQNIFDALPNIVHLPDTKALYDYLDAREPE